MLREVKSYYDERMMLRVRKRVFVIINVESFFQRLHVSEDGKFNMLVELM